MRRGGGFCGDPVPALSGTYNSAILGRSLYLEEHGEGAKQIAVFSSDSASVGEAKLAFRIRELCEAGKTFEEVVREVSDFRDHMNTYFVLETLDFLKKNGRLTGVQALFASVLNIKPVMGADKGTIIKLDQARGIDKALAKMWPVGGKGGGDAKDKILAIAHTNCPERAKKVRDLICRMIKVKDVYIVDTAGVSSTYAGDGGVLSRCRIKKSKEYFCGHRSIVGLIRKTPHYRKSNPVVRHFGAYYQQHRRKFTVKCDANVVSTRWDTQ